MFLSLITLITIMTKNISASLSPIITPVEFGLSTPEETVSLRPKIMGHEILSTKDLWLKMIAGAKKTIELGQFYADSRDKGPLEEVIAALSQAGSRGVKIRFIVSNALLDENPKTLNKIRAIPGLELRVLNLDTLTGGIIHSKYWIVDDHEIYIGSANFDWRSLIHIHETGVRVDHPFLALQLKEIFETDWAIAAKKAPTLKDVAKLTPGTKLAAPVNIELLASPPALTPKSTRSALGALLELLKGAKKSIRFQLLNYSTHSDSPDGKKSEKPWLDIDDALRSAAHRGVHIEMLVSNWNLKAKDLPALKSLAVLPNFTLKIASFPDSKKGFIPYARVIHSKQMIVDDEIYWIGTSNWSEDYFNHSRNVELIFRRHDIAQVGLEIFKSLWNSSYVEKLDPRKNYQPPRLTQE
jgi:phosphatidylserine/phosphatidylglycerophosphate/cardiolipin synthase-like enzyme